MIAYEYHRDIKEFMEAGYGRTVEDWCAIVGWKISDMDEKVLAEIRASGKLYYIQDRETGLVTYNSSEKLLKEELKVKENESKILRN